MSSRFIKILALLVIVSLLGCSVLRHKGKGAGELSTALGKDIASLHLSYRALIERHFNVLRRQALDFLENRWAPVFIEDFMKRGGLVQTARGLDPANVNQGENDWALAAAKTIEKKRKQLIDAIDKDEKDLLEMTDNAFQQILRANNAITAYLGGGEKEKKEKTKPKNPKEGKIKALCSKIDDRLNKASNRAETALSQLKKTNN
jgi:hypothetical protein